MGCNVVKAISVQPLQPAVELVQPTEPETVPIHYAQATQNFVLIWLDEIVDQEQTESYHKSNDQLKQLINTVNAFSDANECINFICGCSEENIFLITSGTLGQTVLPSVHENSQMHAICILCSNEDHYQEMVKQWSKLKGVYTNMASICKVFEQTAKDYEQNAVAICVVKSTDGTSEDKSDRLDQSFMYTQILKEILLTIEFEQKHIDEFIAFCRAQRSNDKKQPDDVDKLEREYRAHTPVWWYTYDCFLYSMLNRAIFTMDVKMIIQMGFFIRDLSKQMVDLHVEQFSEKKQSDSFTLYRGQSLPETKFDQLKQRSGGLFAFEQFVSTSKNEQISIEFIERNIKKKEVSVLFVMTIDPSIPSTPFADVIKYSAIKREQEILFSMHSVFRIGKIEETHGTPHFWRVELTLTSENDPQLHALTEQMRKETSSNHQGWHRLGKLMLKLGLYDKAGEVYELLREQASNEDEKAFLYHEIGYVKHEQGKYLEAIELYEKAVKAYEGSVPPSYPELSTTYNNLGRTYENMGDHIKALSYQEKALEIREKFLPSTHSSFVTSYNNMGSVYDSMGDQAKALLYYEKALKISEKVLPENHPNLATLYNNIGLLYNNRGDYTQALSSLKKGLEIKQRILPASHPSLATSYNNVALVHDNMGEHSSALPSYEKALEISKESLPENHPILVTSYNNIGLLCERMGDYPKALTYLERTHAIGQKTLPAEHPDLLSTQQNIQRIREKLE